MWLLSKNIWISRVNQFNRIFLRNNDHTYYPRLIQKLLFIKYNFDKIINANSQKEKK